MQLHYIPSLLLRDMAAIEVWISIGGEKLWVDGDEMEAGMREMEQRWCRRDAEGRRGAGPGAYMTSEAIGRAGGWEGGADERVMRD